MKKINKEKFEFEAIGVIKSPYQQRFGIPHQAGVSQGLTAILQIYPEADFLTALRGLDTFSHLWIIFVFHDHGGKKWKPTIRPPRLGGNKKVGLFASRSPHRPNPIGMSAVKINKINLNHPDGPQIEISDVDLLEGTPVLDIKPYIPLADKIDSANSGWADIPIKIYQVNITDIAEQKMLELSHLYGEDFKSKAIHMIELDPRPAFQKRKMAVENKDSIGRKFGLDVKIKNTTYDVKYEIIENGFLITDVIKLNK